MKEHCRNNIINKEKMDDIIKYDKDGKILEATESDKEDVENWEAIAKEAVADAIKDLHDKGISTVHGDKKGIYELSPEGVKTYIKIYEATL